MRNGFCQCCLVEFGDWSHKSSDAAELGLSSVWRLGVSWRRGPSIALTHGSPGSPCVRRTPVRGGVEGGLRHIMPTQISLELIGTHWPAFISENTAGSSVFSSVFYPPSRFPSILRAHACLSPCICARHARHFAPEILRPSCFLFRVKPLHMGVAGLYCILSCCCVNLELAEPCFRPLSSCFPGNGNNSCFCPCLFR